jgi:hypothetical protein
VAGYGIEINPSEGSAHVKPDIMGTRYIIFFGTTPYEANFPMQAMARKLNFFRKRGGKLVAAFNLVDEVMCATLHSHSGQARRNGGRLQGLAAGHEAGRH